MKIKSLTTESSGRLNKLNIPFWEKQIKGKKLTEKNEKIISYDVDVAKYSEFFFSNIVQTLNISEKFANKNLPHSLLRHQTSNAILKYKDHRRICINKRVSQFFWSFYFSPVD